MANADKKVTKKQRKLEAKQRRLEELRRRARRQRMRRVYVIAGVAVVIGGIVAAVLAAGSSGRKAAGRLNDLAAAAGCNDLESPNLLPAGHISAPTQASYNTNPPTSGQHYNAPGQGPLPTGIYPQTPQDEGVVHNLEHGHIGIWYTAALNPQIKSGLEAFVGRDAHDRWTFIAPRPDMTDAQLAFTAWGRMLKCTAPKDAASAVAVAGEFYDQFRDKGPESVPGQPIGTTPQPTATASPRATTTPRATPTARATTSPS